MREVNDWHTNRTERFWKPGRHDDLSDATHLTITEVNERNFLPACFDELGLE